MGTDDHRDDSKPGRRPCVLVVHDDPAFVQLIREAFQWYGCGVRIESASTVGAALRRLERSDAPELILIGLPPFGGGNELLACARFACAAMGVRIVQLVHLRREADEERALALGADLYLELPVAWEGHRQLVQRARELLALGREDEAPAV
jgi:DNA-binding response OmpR family regulator